MNFLGPVYYIPKDNALLVNGLTISYALVLKIFTVVYLMCCVKTILWGNILGRIIYNDKVVERKLLLMWIHREITSFAYNIKFHARRR